jgi:hypothetical protein
MKTQINHEKYMALVEKLADMKSLPGMDVLIERFRKLGHYIGMYQSTIGTEDQAIAWQQLQASQKEVEEEFHSICRGWGMTMEEVRAQVENPMNYTPDEWEKVLETKQEVYSVVEREKTSHRPAGVKHKARKWA